MSRRLTLRCARRAIFAALLLGAALASSAVRAQEPLPYGLRTRSYSAFSTVTHGDIRGVGMAGAALGLGDTFGAALESPAGMAMTLHLGDINYASDFIQDGHVQDMRSGIQTNSVGLALPFYPWAAGIGYVSPYREDATYLLRTSPRDPAELSVTTRQIVVSASRLFAHDRLSLGANLILAQASRAIDLAQFRNTDEGFSSYTLGASVGAMVQLPLRFLLEASYANPQHFVGSGAPSPLLPGFFRAVDVPWRAGLGLGWIPNRFFRADLSARVIGATPGASLVRDQAATVGDKVTFQPRFGMAYIFLDYKELKGTLFLGSYFEATRIAGTDDRFHGTGGVEVRLWILTGGFGVDLASQYRNYLFSAGVDVFGVLARLDMIPRVPESGYGRLFPNPVRFSDEGLSRPLVRNWKPVGPEIDPIKAGLELPGKLKQGIENAGSQIEQIEHIVVDTIAPTPPTPPAPTPPTPPAPAPLPSSPVDKATRDNY